MSAERDALARGLRSLVEHGLGAGEEAEAVRARLAALDVAEEPGVVLRALEGEPGAVDALEAASVSMVAPRLAAVPDGVREPLRVAEPEEPGEPEPVVPVEELVADAFERPEAPAVGLAFGPLLVVEVGRDEWAVTLTSDSGERLSWPVSGRDLARLAALLSTLALS